MARRIPLIWSNDDIMHGKVDQQRRQLAFLDRLEIPGSFFLVPSSSGQPAKTLDDDAELMRMIDKSRAQGHEYIQHGYVHSPFESGVPPTWMLDFAPDVRRRYDEQRLQIEATHTFEAMVHMLEQGRRIWRRAFGEDSAGYRPGWGAMCRNLYRALEALGFQWVSSQLPMRTSWLWNQEMWDEPIDLREDARVAPYRIGNLLEIPIGGDYGFRVPNEPDRIDAMVQLGMTEFEYCHERGWPMVIVSHPHGLERNEDSGYAVHEKLIPALLATGRVEPMTLTQLYERTVKAESEPPVVASSA